MASITVHEFQSYPNAQNEFLWPAARTTKDIVAGATHTTGTNTRAIVITTDTDTRVSLDGSAATVGDLPVLSAVENPYIFGDPGVYTLKFLA